MRYEELLAIVRKVEPLVREHAERGDRERRVPKETADALRAAGLFRIWIPKSLGGWEVDPVTAARVFEEVARIDSGAAWALQMCCNNSMLCAWFGDEAVAEMHEVPEPVFGDAFAPPMRLDRVEGGWRATGRVPFASNCHHIDWFFGLGHEHEGDGPKPGPDGEPEGLTFAVPRGDFEIVENWNTLGMRGTGSDDVRLEGVFIPDRRVVPFAPIGAAARNRDYRVPMIPLGPIWQGITSMGAVGLGIAQGARDEFLDLCETKTAAFAPSKVGEEALTHYRLGEAHAQLGAARAYLYAALGEGWERVRSGEALRDRDRCEMAAASTFVFQAASRAFDLIAESAGTSMIRDEHPLSRRFRDLRTLTQHIFTAKNRYRDIGLMLLGNDPAFDMLGF